MKKYVFLLLSCALFSTAHAQKVVVPEPEFINSYCVLTSDSTFDVLPKESGKVEKHQSKFHSAGYAHPPLDVPQRRICPSSARRPPAPDMPFRSAGYVRSAGYALSSVRRPGGFAIRRQKMT